MSNGRPAQLRIMAFADLLQSIDIGLWAAAGEIAKAKRYY
jgi:hypothetical protein